MKKGLIILVIGGVLLLAAGGAMVGVAYAKGVFTNNSYTKEETNNHFFNESFSKLDLSTVTADLTIKEAEDDKTTVVCVEREKIKHEVNVTNDTLVIKEKDDRAWYEKWFSNFGRMSVTVYLPSNTYSELNIKITTGDTLIENSFNFDKQNIKVTTGDITLNHVTGQEASLETTTGKINLSNYVITGSLNIKTVTGDVKLSSVRSGEAKFESTNGDYDLDDYIANGKLMMDVTTGDIKFKNCDAASLDIKTTTGDIEGNLLTNKKFIVDTTTSKPNYPHDMTGPECKIKTTTGKINISVGAI